MMTTTAHAHNDKILLNGWLNAVNAHISQRRVARGTAGRPKRNRAREAARREARQLFREYELDLALSRVY